MKSPMEPVVISAGLLRSWPLPQPEREGDKDARGKVLIIAGTDGMPGAAILSSTAALRAGAGKLLVATPKKVAPWVAVSVPESYVIGLPEKRAGVLSLTGVQQIRSQLEGADAVLIGPGMAGDRDLAKFIAATLPFISSGTLILDAEALKCFCDAPQFVSALEGRVIVTPHAGEMATMMGCEKRRVLGDPQSAARDFAAKCGTVTVMKGSRTHIAAPGGELFANDAGNVGLATSGSGDTLSGIIAGLCARGAEPLQAAVWGVYLHALAGDVLAKKMGTLGFLARELLDEIPPLMARLSK